MNRRGEEIVPTAFLEIVVSVFLIFLMLLFAVKMYGLFFAVDDNALNTYRLIVDTTEGFLQNPTPNQTTSFTLTQKEQGKFKGTIFGLYQDGGFQLTDPFPPVGLEGGTAMQEAEKRVMTAALWEKECDKKACLCFSKKTLPDDATRADLIKIYENPYQCDPLAVPEGKSLLLSTINPEIQWEVDEEFTEVALYKRTFGDEIRIRIWLEIPS